MPFAFSRPLPLAALALAASTVAGHALEVTRSADIAAPPAKVWQTIGEFCGIGDWHPAIEKCVLSDKDGLKVRTLSLKGGGTLKEEQVSRDDKVMSYTYTILEGPLPVADYKSTLAVAPEGTGSKVTWSGTFNAKGAPDTVAVDAIQGIYESGLKALSDKAK
ncbi:MULTISPECIES: SRPBCC family protein [Methylobacterium]|uniref:SRPBCC family protein n=1 Tax=Methylobacterium TaxID=407 RepID=UPI0011C83930|nr:MULTISPECIES: SRPBCC family protein [Methylobacterium]TXN02537.1 SRPBCC family protein [Methylobacterium sp. WL64]TXN45697.1 SRPBCC family protein [Methylobacterium sp. WL7]TXN53900.1 SRPBCC family protein [Methylobacterium sp. WL18]GJE20176.1 IS1595 family transposase ISMpo2 [Methylobacterium mesophilicum]